MAWGAIHIGTSGWSYPHWIGPYYPDGTKAASFLSVYARDFASVEINQTFYQLPAPSVVGAWHDETPANFVFACKASRYITHMKKLKDPVQSTERFFDAIAPLGDKLGPILFQLPPRWRVNGDRLANFLDALPESFRYAFEFRDKSWFTAEVYGMLACRDAAVCTYDLDGWRSPVKLTASFMYIRLHGPDGPYRGTYDGRTLFGWARRIESWAARGCDVFCYFDNDEKGFAAIDARRLAAMINGGDAAS
jgi:uncharacterized protein YecE (DUF72 family)